jgi:outer membrane protein OmpA-like peptidoglycan-associated protein
MKNYLTLIICLALAGSLFAQEDAEGSKDPALFTRMPGYHIYRYDDIQFDKYEFRISDEKNQVVEGHHLFILYDLNNNVQVPSPLQTVRNYTNAIKKVGGQLIYEFEDGGIQNVILKLVKSGQETWAHVIASGNGQYSIHIIEKQAMNQDVIADASSMGNSIKESGKVAVYGIYFDIGKAVLKPESQPTLQEIAKLLKADPALKLYVVGHTDNTGLFDANMKLSIDRAAAVVASNDNEEGKALNRRVELVKQ